MRWARGAGVVGPFVFMVLLGLGLYVPYVAVHTTIFGRLIAMTRDRGNIGYLMYLADAFGYLGYVAVMIGKNHTQRHQSDPPADSRPTKPYRPRALTRRYF